MRHELKRPKNVRNVRKTSETSGDCLVKIFYVLQRGNNACKGAI